MDAVVVSYNSEADLRRQLSWAPLREAFGRVVVVDNDSADGSVAVAEQAGVEVAQTGRNAGFGAAANLGVRATGSEHVAILNPDVLVDDPAQTARLAARFEADPRAGLIAPALVLPDGRVQDSARAIPAPVELVRRRLTGAELGAVRPEGLETVPWVVAAFIVVRRTAFDEVDGFDEAYRLYFEDVDLCVRLWSAGWRVLLDGTERARHEHAASSRKSLVGWAMRRHTTSAGRFFATHPDLLTASGRARLVR